MALQIETEKKLDTEPCLVAWDDGQLFVGNEDGSIKSFNTNLSSPGASWPAHGAQLFGLAAGNGFVYSSSNDGGVRVWTPRGEKVKEMPNSGADVGVLRVFGKYLCTGDEDGNATIYYNNEEKAQYNLLQEVKDIAYKPPFLFTVRDLDVTVTEINPIEHKTRFTTMHTMEGCAPLRISGNRLLVMARGGNALKLYDASVETIFKKLHEVKVSDMIVTSLSVSGDYAWTGGWDGTVRRWLIAAGDTLEPAGELSLGSCINSLDANEPGNCYAALSGRRVVRVRVA